LPFAQVQSVDVPQPAIVQACPSIEQRMPSRGEAGQSLALRGGAQDQRIPAC
jgi:hypothetical protein